MNQIRTQISLPADLKQDIESAAHQHNFSLAEFLRQAAQEKLDRAKNKQKDLNSLADKIIGSLEIDQHPEWATPEAVNAWVREGRKDRE